MFLTESATHLSIRDTFAEASSEAEWNWTELAQPSTITRKGALVATFDGALHPLVRNL